MGVNSDSYTSVMITWLSETHHYDVNGRGKAIGGALPSRETLNSCFEHMRAWVLLARDVVAAEFPSFDVVCSFNAFSVIEPNKKVTDNKVKKKLDRLAHVQKAKAMATIQLHVGWSLLVAERCTNLVVQFMMRG